MGTNKTAEAETKEQREPNLFGLFQVDREEDEFKQKKNKSNQINVYGTSIIEFFIQNEC